MRKIVVFISLAICCAVGILAPVASADAWTDGQIQWVNCKDAGHPDDYCRAHLNSRPLPAPAPAPAPAPSGSTG
ncbi:hypothetical protein [Nocardia miyunensis]|uniref:hypothetical protein n=1 Tax=Nocardia miyunensis TaxID=282684 RepID=UPI0012F4F0A4|nr:hypothetical protein [Nocardia miyunensis]